MDRQKMNPAVDNNMSAKKRNIPLDIAKGIAMLLVIVGHCDYIPFHPIRHFIYSFHMPLFILVSGFFYKKRSVKETLKKDLRHLGIPYILTCLAIVSIALIYYLISKDGEPLGRLALASLFGNGGQHSCKYLSDLPGIGPLWFLPALFVCKNVYNILPERNRLLYSSVIFLAATVIGRYLIFIPFSVLSGLAAIVFYAIGDYLKTVKRITWPWWIAGIACWIISVIYSRVYLVTPRFDLYYIDVIGATAASLLVYLLSKQIARVPLLMKCLSWTGRNSLYLLCFHSIENDCGIARELSITQNMYVVLLLSLLIPIVCTYLFTKVQAVYKAK